MNYPSNTTGLKMYNFTQCTGNIGPLYRYRDSVSAVYRQCTSNVPVAYRQCTGSVLTVYSVYRQCIGNYPAMYRQCLCKISILVTAQFIEGPAWWNLGTSESVTSFIHTVLRTGYCVRPLAKKKKAFDVI